jgi:amino acid transporter
MSTGAVPAAGTVSPREAVVAETELKSGALGFWGQMVQAVTHIAPGLNILLGLTFIVSFAGVTAPIAYLLGGVICLLVAIVLTQLAKEFNGAGGYFLYVSKTIGPRFGWLTTWLYFLYDPVAVAAVCAFTGSLVESTLQAQYGFHLSWYITFFILLAAVFVFTYFGVALSIKVLLVLALFEVGVFTVLGLSGLISPGRGGFNVSSFNPSNIPSGNGLWLGVVFTILALSGFESVAPLAEETRNPRRTLPIAIVGSTILVAIFYTLVNWGVLVGMGTANLDHYLKASDPIFELGRRLWGGAWIVILIATINSSLAVCIAIQNASTRVFFGMGRAGALPKILAKVHPRWKTPTAAIWFLTAMTVILGMGVGAGIGPVNMFGTIGIMQTLGLIIVYIMGNVGVSWYYWRKQQGQFNVLLHGIIPLVSSGLLGYVFYKNVYTLHPFNPVSDFDYSPLIVIIWTLVGIAVLVAMRVLGKEAWLFRAGEAAHERPETAEERAHESVL